VADKITAESEISDYFQNQQSKGWYHPLMGHFAYTCTYISACGGASNAISNHNTMFSGSGKSVAPLATLPHYTGSRNSRWQSSKPEVPIFQLVEELATRFQIIIPRFGAIQWRHSMLTYVQVEIWVFPDWRPPSWIFHFGLGRTVLQVLPLDCWTPKHRFSHWICVAVVCISGDMSTSGLAAAILDLSLPIRLESIVGMTVRLLDANNIGLSVGIALLLCVQLEFPHEEVVTLFTNEKGTP